MVAHAGTLTIQSPEVQAILKARAGRFCESVQVTQPDEPPYVAASRRQQIIASMPSAADLDLIVIDPPAEWLADKGWK